MLVFCALVDRCYEIQTRHHNISLIYRRARKFRDFWTISRCISERARDRGILQWSTIPKSYVLYWTTWSSMTLGDLSRSFWQF